MRVRERKKYLIGEMQLSIAPIPPRDLGLMEGTNQIHSVVDYVVLYNVIV